MANSNIASLGQAFSDMETSPVFAFDDFARYWGPTANNFRRFVKKGGEQDQLYDMFKQSYLANSGQAQENANIYRDYAKGLFANQPNQFNDYSKTADLLYGHFNDFANTSKNAGDRSMNERAAALGFGGQGNNSYLAKINADRITNNLAPAFANTTNAIGRDYNSMANNNWRETMLRLGLANNDALTGYSDNVAYRPIDVANTRMGMMGANNQIYGGIMDNYMKNVAGYETKETSDWAKGIGVVDNVINGAVDLYMSQYGGGMGGMGGGGGGGQQQSINPYSMQMMPQNGYPTNPGAGQPMPPAQNQAWMNEFRGAQQPYVPSYQDPRLGGGYLGDIYGGNQYTV